MCRFFFTFWIFSNDSWAAIHSSFLIIFTHNFSSFWGVWRFLGEVENCYLKEDFIQFDARNCYKFFIETKKFCDAIEKEKKKWKREKFNINCFCLCWHNSISNYANRKMKRKNYLTGERKRNVENWNVFYLRKRKKNVALRALRLSRNINK